MYCRYCGKKVLEGSQYCNYCGKKLVDSHDKEASIAEKKGR